MFKFKAGEKMSGEIEAKKPSFNNVSVFEKYNMLEKIKEWRLAGYSYRATTKKIEEEYGVKINFSTLYQFCVKHGLDGDMSGEREKAINSYNELIDSLKIVNKGIAVTQAALEETENSLNNGEFDAKSYSSVFNTLDKLLARRESLISAITHYQGLIYKYSKIDQFMSRIQEIIIDHGGLTLWNTIYKSVQDDFILRELLKEIPKEEDKTMKIPAAKSITKKRKGS